MGRLLPAVAVLALGLSPAGAQGLVKVRVATIPLENSAQAFYAKEMGFFAKEGLDVEMTSIQSGSAVAAAVVSNAVDVGFASIIPLAIAHNKNIPFVLIAPGAEWTQAARNDALFVPSNSTARSAKDLNGKTVACAGLGTLTEYAARAWISQNGGDLSSVKFLEMGYSAMPAALSAGRIDAALVNEPYLGAAKKDSRLLSYPFDAVSKQFLIGGWFATSQWASDHPDVVKRFAAAMREAALFANTRANDAKSGEILSTYTKIDPAVIAAMVRVHFAETLSPAAVQPQVDTAAKYGGFTTFPAAQIVYAPR
jgi:NitT/TauT family transport system substrate-binding protein